MASKQNKRENSCDRRMVRRRHRSEHSCDRRVVPANDDTEQEPENPEEDCSQDSIGGNNDNNNTYVKMLGDAVEEAKDIPGEILKIANRTDLVIEVGLYPVGMVAAVGNDHLLKMFLNDGFNVNTKCSPTGFTALMLASLNKHLKTVELLLRSGSDVSLTNEEGRNALMISVQTGEAKVINAIWPYIKSHKQDIINQADINGWTCLNFALDKNWDTCCKFLIKNNIKVNTQSVTGETPLMQAAKKGVDIKLIKHLLTNNADATLEDEDGCTALCKAVVAQKYEILEHIFSQMDVKSMDHLVKGRIERLRHRMANNQSSSLLFVEDISLPLLAKLASNNLSADTLLKQKLVTNLVTIFQKYLKHHNLVGGALEICGLCMCTKKTETRDKFIIQFVRAKGPDLVLKALTSYKNTSKVSSDVKNACMLPLKHIHLVAEGRAWVEKNVQKIVPFKDIEPPSVMINLKISHTINIITTYHKDFSRYFQNLLEELAARKQAEILEDEERERARANKKREKKKLYRQNKQTVSEKQKPINDVWIPNEYLPFEESKHVENDINPPDTVEMTSVKDQSEFDTFGMTSLKEHPAFDPKLWSEWEITMLDEFITTEHSTEHSNNANENNEGQSAIDVESDHFESIWSTIPVKKDKCEKKPENVSRSGSPKECQSFHSSIMEVPSNSASVHSLTNIASDTNTAANLGLTSPNSTKYTDLAMASPTTMQYADAAKSKPQHQVPSKPSPPKKVQQQETVEILNVSINDGEVIIKPQYDEDFPTLGSKPSKPNGKTKKKRAKRLANELATQSSDVNKVSSLGQLAVSLIDDRHMQRKKITEAPPVNTTQKHDDQQQIVQNFKNKENDTNDTQKEIPRSQNDTKDKESEQETICSAMAVAKSELNRIANEKDETENVAQVRESNQSPAHGNVSDIFNSLCTSNLSEQATIRNELLRRLFDSTGGTPEQNKNLLSLMESSLMTYCALRSPSVVENQSAFGDSLQSAQSNTDLNSLTFASQNKNSESKLSSSIEGTQHAIENDNQVFLEPETLTETQDSRQNVAVIQPCSRKDILTKSAINHTTPEEQFARRQQYQEDQQSLTQLQPSSNLLVGGMRKNVSNITGREPVIDSGVRSPIPASPRMNQPGSFSNQPNPSPMGYVWPMDPANGHKKASPIFYGIPRMPFPVNGNQQQMHMSELPPGYSHANGKHSLDNRAQQHQRQYQQQHQQQHQQQQHQQRQQQQQQQQHGSVEPITMMQALNLQQHSTMQTYDIQHQAMTENSMPPVRIPDVHWSNPSRNMESLANVQQKNASMSSDTNQSMQSRQRQQRDRAGTTDEALGRPTHITQSGFRQDTIASTFNDVSNTTYAVQTKTIDSKNISDMSYYQKLQNFLIQKERQEKSVSKQSEPLQLNDIEADISDDELSDIEYETDHSQHANTSPDSRKSGYTSPGKSYAKATCQSSSLLEDASLHLQYRETQKAFSSINGSSVLQQNIEPLRIGSGYVEYNVNLQNKTLKQPTDKGQFVQTLIEPIGHNRPGNVRYVEDDFREVAFPAELRGEDGDNDARNGGADQDCLPAFPGFHDDTKESGRDSSKSSAALNHLQKMHLANYYRSRCMGDGLSNSLFNHNFHYYASAIGETEESIKALINGDIPVNEELSVVDPNKYKRFQDIRKTFSPEKGKTCIEQRYITDNKHIESNTHTYKQSDRQIHPKTLSNWEDHFPEHYRVGIRHVDTQRRPTVIDKSFMCIRNGEIATEGEQEVPLSIPWKPCSKRWKDRLTELYNTEPSKLRRVGDIIIPADFQRQQRLICSDSFATLGLLIDGTEVAVSVCDTTSRSIETEVMKLLTSSNFSHYFLTKYHTFVIDDTTCYTAISLYEYTLPEYLKMLQMDISLDPLSVNKIVWQLLKGLAFLHEQADCIHGNMMPSNVLVDSEGKLQLSEYGITGKRVNTGPLINRMDVTEDRRCWLPTEIATEEEEYTKKSDIQVAGMLIYFILTGGKHPFGEKNIEIQVNIQQNWSQIMFLNDEANHLLTVMLNTPHTKRPTVTALLKHPYFWGDEKKLRFVLIAGSDVLRDIKVGGAGSPCPGDTMIEILNASSPEGAFADWTTRVDAQIMREMRSFRQYKNSLSEFVLFVYNVCLHFDKLPADTRDIIEEPCTYFLELFPNLFMAVYVAIRDSQRAAKTCYKPFF